MVAAVLLAVIAASHPDLRFVDFIGFATRARLLPDGSDLINPLYPVGYPAALLVGKGLVGDVLIAGKALAVLAGAGAVWAVSRWISPWAGLWMLCSAAMLEWGATEGTDMAAASLSLGGLLAVRSRPGLAGAMLGAAFLARYTAIAALPVALIFSSRRRSVAAMFALITAPHWGCALWLGTSVLPDQSSNFAIGGARGGLLSMETLRRLPHGLGRAALAVVELPREGGGGGPPGLATMDRTMLAGLAGLVVGLLRRDWRAAALVLLTLLHLAGVGMAFVNPRLVLPATLCVVLGVAWLVPRRLLIPAAVVALWLNLPAAREPSVVSSSLAKITVQCDELEGPILTSSPWFHTRTNGWIESGILLRRLGDSRRLDPATLRSRALAWEVHHVALDIGRVRASYPGLSLLARGKDVEGFVEIAKSPGWRVYRLK
ncbi:MAG: hypothetical protein ACI8RZ_004746, partial [Myxococcota bacterium]